MAFGFTGRSKACYQGKRQQQTILFPGSYQLQTWSVEPGRERGPARVNASAAKRPAKPFKAAVTTSG